AHPVAVYPDPLLRRRPGPGEALHPIRGVRQPGVTLSDTREPHDHASHTLRIHVRQLRGTIRRISQCRRRELLDRLKGRHQDSFGARYETTRSIWKAPAIR